MSYEKVKCITRKPKENKIIITSACNNVRPLTFEKWEYGKADMSYKEKMFYLFFVFLFIFPYHTFLLHFLLLL